MKKTNKNFANRYIAAALALIAILLLTGPASRADDVQETPVEAAEEEHTRQPREIAHTALEAQGVKLYVPEDETPSEGNDGGESAEDAPDAAIDYAALVDREAWAAEITAITKTLRGEYNHVETAEDKQQAAAVVWCILWRAEDTESRLFPNTVLKVIRQKGQFAGYREGNWADPALREIAVDVLGRYLAYKDGAALEEVGCVLPPEYHWFTGRQGKNWFRDAFDGSYTVWDWSWGNPYEEGSA